VGLRLVDIGWLAGIIEGEGCFYISRQYTNPSFRIQVNMTDKDVIEKLQRITNLGNLYVDNHKGKKTSYIWIVSRAPDVVALMMTLYPLMGERRQKKIRECLIEWRSFPYRHQLSREERLNQYDNNKWKRALGY